MTKLQTQISKLKNNITDKVVKIKFKRIFSFQVQVYSQCNLNGPTCIAGSSCYIQNAWYAQCLYSCPIGWYCQGK